MLPFRAGLLPKQARTSLRPFQRNRCLPWLDFALALMSFALVAWALPACPASTLILYTLLYGVLVVSMRYTLGVYAHQPLPLSEWWWRSSTAQVAAIVPLVLWWWSHQEWLSIKFTLLFGLLAFLSTSTAYHVMHDSGEGSARARKAL